MGHFSVWGTVYLQKKNLHLPEKSEDRVLMVTGEPKHEYVTFQNASVTMHSSVDESIRIILCFFPINKTNWTETSK